MVLYPMLLKPALHKKVWGGRRLATHLHKTLPDEQPYGESWELHDTSTVINGEHAGKTIAELVAQYGTDLIGAGNDPAEGMPLLAKFLDASQWLSVQVHPDDAQARELEGDPRGKTEAWVILAAKPGSKLVIGVKQGTTRAMMAQAIRENVLEDLLVYAPVQMGDVLYVRANTVHALGPGLLIYEIQQSSNVTYRLYDWGRMGLDGKPRELHIEKGVQVANLETLPPITHAADGDRAVVAEGPYFKTEWHRLHGEKRSLTTEGKFHVLTCTHGTLAIAAHDHTLEISTGQSALIPAALPDYTITGNGDVLVSFQGAGT